MTTTDGAASAAAPAAQVDIVTVNWNAGPQLEACARSVMAVEPGIVGKFVIVDNGSRDGSADFDLGWDKLVIDKTGQNLGFGRACNRGAAQGRAPYILLLNPDTRLIEPAIRKAVAFLERTENARYGICGIKLIDDTGEATRHTARFPSFWTLVSTMVGLQIVIPIKVKTTLMIEWDHLDSRPVDHVQGAFYLIRRSLFEQLGGFDEDYFVYLEDLDLSLRVKQAGYGSYYLSDARAYHYGGGTAKQVKGRARFYYIHARFTYIGKHFSRPKRLLHDIGAFTIEPAFTLLWNLIRRQGRGFGMRWEGIALTFGHARTLITRERLYPSAPRVAGPPPRSSG